MKEVFIVSGHTGDYENHVNWMAFAVFTELEAVLVTEKLNAILSEHKVCRTDEVVLPFMEIYKNHDKLRATIREQTTDEKFEVSEDGTFYDWEKVKLIWTMKEMK